ncbi:coxsackievirus and adenovirus receptor homolog [Parambassis ranga]|uniref:Coxsackievirus and adenovirus receptor homolog n=1 Tax=Parambassis ranga TaxID=210632 RepID=A0A6P7I282_9TELE|nr:coxsackievirus and adenovirus receptor homolog [Parambassis ranga]
MEQILCSLTFLLAGAVGQTVVYPFTSTCAVKGSTVTLPCTFTPRQSAMKDGQVFPLHIVRVVWCQNHLICQGSTPSVYDSESQKNNTRYKYLGDKKGDCTLQIRDVQQDDNTTFRFRMEADNPAGHFTNQTGVTVTVHDNIKMRTHSSSGEKRMKSGETVSLQCTATCTLHPLEVTWFKDGHTLPEHGPTLQIGPLTAQHSGNYTCSLRSSMETMSVPYSLQVAPDEE